jgi:integrase
LTVRILKPLLKSGPDPSALVFRGLPIPTSKGGQPQFNSVTLISKLAQHGAPNFVPHGCRHTIASWLKAGIKYDLL